MRKLDLAAAWPAPFLRSQVRGATEPRIAAKAGGGGSSLSSLASLLGVSQLVWASSAPRGKIFDRLLR